MYSPLPALTGIALVLLSSACGRAPAPESGEETAHAAGGIAADTAGTPVADFQSIAAKVVGQSAGVKENEVVQLFGGIEDLPLLEDMAVEVRRRGAHPIVLVGTEKLGRRMYDEVPARYDAQEPRELLGLLQVVDVVIGTEAGEGRTYKGVPVERQAARARSFQSVAAMMQKRGIRSITLGNGLYPSAERAEQFGIPRNDLARLMYGGVDADYQQLQATGERLRAALARGKELRITSPSGTDLRLSITGRPVHVSDGVISPEDRKRGGTALSAWLPAGEVYLVPAAGDAQGTVVADRYYYQGDRVDGLRLEIKGGKLVGMTAASGLEPLKARYEAAGAGRDLLGVVDIGINSAIQTPAGTGVNVWSRAGAVTVVVGNNVWAGGGNRSDFGLSADVPRATLSVDGTELVKDGKLVGSPAVAAR